MLLAQGPYEGLAASIKEDRVGNNDIKENRVGKNDELEEQNIIANLEQTTLKRVKRNYTYKSLSCRGTYNKVY